MNQSNIGSSNNENNTESSPSFPPDYTPYEQWVRRLYMTNIFHPVKLGLDNIEHLYNALGRPLDEGVTVLHVAGTNGKGSVVHKLAHTLQLCNPNNRVGMFMSPHISSFRERIQCQSQYISEDQVVQLLPRIYEICVRDDIPATFFEITTALAFAFFAQQRCNVVVLETGLGGRLDSTNVLTSTTLAIITSIGLEHTRILGDTIELIAKEKGGIIKQNRPVLVGPGVPHDVLRQCAQDKHASAYYISDELVRPHPLATAVDDDATMTVDYDQENTRIAEAALQLLQELEPSVCEGLTPNVIAQGTSVRPPCRFETVTATTPQLTRSSSEQQHTTVVLDVAHNPPAMEYLAAKLHSTFPGRQFRMVVGMSADKDLAQCGAAALKAVRGDASRLHLVEAAHPRAATLKDILEACGEDLFSTIHSDGPRHPPRRAHFNMDDRSVTYQIQKALQILAQQDSDEEVILVVCGSVFLMAEAREALGFDEPRDSKYIAEVAGAGSRHGQENFGNSGGVTTLSPDKQSNP